MLHLRGRGAAVSALGQVTICTDPAVKKIGEKAYLGKSTTPKSMALSFRAENFMFGRQRRVKWAGEG